jgi:hypothetical protein
VKGRTTREGETMNRLTEEKIQDINDCLGNYSFTTEDLADPEATAREMYAGFTSLVGSPAWEQPLKFDETDLLAYILRHKEWKSR